MQMVPKRKKISCAARGRGGRSKEKAQLAPGFPPFEIWSCSTLSQQQQFKFASHDPIKVNT
jgi:hypothetical protein